MFDTILVPVDGSEDGWIAADQAIEIAKEEGARVIGLFVIDVKALDAVYWFPSIADVDTLEVDYIAAGGFQEIEKGLHEQGEQTLETLKNRCAEAGVSFEGEIAEGVVEREIIRRAENADLVVMGRRGSGAKWAGPLLGSTFEAVIRHSPKPVLATHSSPRPIRRILVAFDGSDRSWDALRIAAHWGAESKREIVLLTVDDGKERRKEASDEGTAYLEKLGVRARRLFLSGHPAEVILKTAEDEECDLIALGAYGHSRFLRIFFGSTVDEVLHSSGMPVLITR